MHQVRFFFLFLDDFLAVRLAFDWVFGLVGFRFFREGLPVFELGFAAFGLLDFFLANFFLADLDRDSPLAFSLAFLFFLCPF